MKKYFFWLAAIADLLVVILELTELRLYTKPLLMVALLIYFWSESDHLKNEKWTRFVTLALVFSWIGDVMLLFVTRHFMFFFAGLSGFLIAHIMYIVAYLQATNKTTARFSFGIFPLVIVIYLCLMGYLIIPYLDGYIQAPVVMYAVILVAMVLAAWSRKGGTNEHSFRLTLMGATLFMISDSILAINRFSHTIDFAGIAVMTTYILGQWFIVNGLLYHSKIINN